MNDTATLVYVASLAVLFGKFAVAISLQASQRLGSRGFRYPEDAAHWSGEVSQDSDLCDRAQRLLRNDTESQPYYFVIGAAYLVLGAWPAGAPFYFAGYTLARCAHAYFLLRGLQPHRFRAFSASLVIVVLLTAHVFYAAALRVFA